MRMSELESSGNSISLSHPVKVRLGFCVGERLKNVTVTLNLVTNSLITATNQRKNAKY